MDKVIETANKLKDELYNLEEFKEYFKYKDLYENDIELNNLKKKLVTVKDKEAHDKLLQEFNSNPIVVNYNYYREEISTILRTVKNLIN